MTVPQPIAIALLGAAWLYGVYNTSRAHNRTTTRRRRGLFVRVGWRDLTPDGRRLALHGLAGYIAFLLIGLALAYLAP